MMPSSPLYCDACGAANPTQATLCWACGQRLAASTENTVSASSSPVEQPTPPPALLVGRYRLMGMIGTGGFGAVYKAEDLQRQSALVAIKSINLHGLSSQEIIEATDTFNREVGMLSGLQHANLPRIYGHFTDREHWYLAMDFIAGETLDEYLSKLRRGHLTVETVLDIGIQLCEVLGYLHSQQPPIIFRDVKPANVMRTATGHLYLIDFGIARRFRPGQKHDTTVLGSPGYAPPEQYGRAQTTVQSDIYSLGATLRFLLTGKEPSEAFPSPASSYIQEVPVELQQLLVQMLKLDASKRPVSMSVVKQALQRIQDERLHVRSRQPVRPPQQTAPPAGTAGGQILQPPATRPARRGISRRVVIVGLAGLAIGGITWMFSQGSQIIQSPQSFPQSPQVPPDPHLLYTYRGHSDGVNAVAWSPDGKRIASGGQDNTVQVWDAVDGGNVFTYRGHSDPVAAVAWSPDGRRIASGGWDNTVQVWDAADGGHAFTYHGHSVAVFAVAWSPDGRRIASGSGDNTVRVWDAADGGHAFTYRGHSAAVAAVAWSPDGRRIASSSEDVQVWDAADGGHAFTYRGHSAAVDAVAWSPDGRRIASGGWGNTVQVWQAG
jgi:serine/threonine protein kinase